MRVEDALADRLAGAARLAEAETSQGQVTGNSDDLHLDAIRLVVGPRERRVLPAVKAAMEHRSADEAESVLLSCQFVVGIEVGPELVPVRSDRVGELVAVDVGHDHAGPEGLAQLDHVLPEGLGHDRLPAESPDRLPQLDRREALTRVESQEGDDLEHRAVGDCPLRAVDDQRSEQLHDDPLTPRWKPGSGQAHSTSGESRRARQHDPALTIRTGEGSPPPNRDRSCGCRPEGEKPGCPSADGEAYRCTGCSRRVCRRTTATRPWGAAGVTADRRSGDVCGHEGDRRWIESPGPEVAALIPEDLRERRHLQGDSTHGAVEREVPGTVHGEGTGRCGDDRSRCPSVS